MSKDGRFELSTEKSLFKPIILTIDGKEYESRRFTRLVMEALQEHEAGALKGNADDIYAQVKILFMVTTEQLNQFDIREIQEFLEFCTDELVKQRHSKSVKKVSKPGVTNSPRSPRSSRASSTKKR